MVRRDGRAAERTWRHAGARPCLARLAGTQCRLPQGGDLKEGVQEFDVSAGGDVRIAHAVLDAASLQPLYLTPEVARGERSSLAVLKLATPGPYEVYVNESLAARGEQRVQGQTLRVARIAADKPIQSGRHYIMSEFEALVRYRHEADEPPAPETRFGYWSQAGDGSVIEPRS